MKKVNKKGFFFKIREFYQKKIKKSKLKFNMVETIVLMLIVFALGLVIGGVIMYGKGVYSSSSISLNEFASTYNEIVDSYYQEVDKDKLLEAGISGMIRYLGDPYSTYMSKDTADDFNEEIDGTYQGIGAEIKYNDNKEPIFGRIFEGSPAEKAGILENDKLIKVIDQDVTKKSLSDIASMVKGEKGTEVTLTIIHDGEEKNIVVTRGVVDNISVTSEIIEKDNKKIGYIYISVFASNTTKQFKKELEKLEKDGINSLIIDVRGNTGGYLTSVEEMIELFIKKDEIIYKLKTKEKIEVIRDKTDEFRSYPIVVLVDGASASASELLAGALKETYHAKLVGTKTFGKGKVQKVSTLSSGALFKYTYQEWLTPDGNYIDGEGIQPDVEIKYVYNEKKPEKDNQKEKAIEIISEQ